MSNKITFELVADDGQIKKGFVNVERQATKTSSKIRSSFNTAFTGLSTGLRGVARGFTDIRTLAVGFVAALGVKRMISTVVDAAKVQEDAVNALNSSLIASGKYSAQTSKDLQDYASELQTVTRYGDETTLQTMALIQSLGNLSGQALKDATKATMDMASALKIDLNTAALLVGKAAAGEVGSLSRYGLIVKKGADNAQTFANVLDAVNSKFGGAAARDALTYSGATQKLSNSFGDMLEKLGETITKNETVTAMVREIQVMIDEFSKFIVSKTPQIKEFMNQALVSIFNFSIGAVQGLQQVILTLSKTVVGLRGFGATFTRIMKTSGFATRFLTDALTDGFDTAKKNWKQNMEGVKKDFDESLINAFDSDQTVKNISKFLDPVLEKANEYSARLGEISQTQVETISNATTEIVQDTANKTLSVQDMFENVSTENQDALDKAIDSSIEKTKQFGEAISNTLKQGVVNTISGGVQSIVTALMAGENAFENFGKFILGVLGDMAIQVGNVVIGTAISMKALGEAIVGFLGPAPTVAILAGVALIAIGSLLKSLSGSGGATGTPASAATVPVTGGSDGSQGTFTDVVNEDSVNEKTTPSVTVNIQGNVLDRKESGLEIVNILNTAFRDQGLKLKGST